MFPNSDNLDPLSYSSRSFFLLSTIILNTSVNTFITPRMKQQSTLTIPKTWIQNGNSLLSQTVFREPSTQQGFKAIMAYIYLQLTKEHKIKARRRGLETSLKRCLSDRQMDEPCGNRNEDTRNSVVRTSAERSKKYCIQTWEQMSKRPGTLKRLNGLALQLPRERECAAGGKPMLDTQRTIAGLFQAQ